MSEAEIARTAPPALADLPDDFWDDAVVVAPVSKQAISLRVDEDVLDWFKRSGPRYQTRMNAVLRAYVSAERRRSDNAAAFQQAGAKQREQKAAMAKKGAR